MNTDSDLIYVVRSSGHRQAYLDLLGRALGLTPVSEPMTPGLFARLVRARRLLFATLDDDVGSFVAVTCLRSLIGKRTAAVFLRPRQCFETGKFMYRVKRLIFKALRRVPGATIVTIIPFGMDPRFAAVAHEGVHDPQLWDLHDGRAIEAAARTELSDQVQAAANGRRVVCMLGSLTDDKGFSFLAEILARSPELQQEVLVVAAGIVPPESTHVAKRFVEAGGMLVDRRISDHELFSLYRVANMIWSCYAPEYNQASGIFGRAVQLGIPAIVRRGSYLEKYAGECAAPIVRVDFDDTAQGSAALNARGWERLRGAPLESHVDAVGRWRGHCLGVLASALQIPLESPQVLGQRQGTGQ
jgi:glycosyltransferase involved in cell wall biosynthesis